MSDDYTPDELARMEEDLAYWKVLEQYIPGWTCFGWTYRQSAIFDTRAGENSIYSQTITLTGAQRDQIVEALYRAEGRIK